MRIVSGLFALLIVLAGASTVCADKIALLKFEGPQASAIQKSLQKVLRTRGYEVVVVKAQGDESGVTLSISGKVSKSKQRWRVAFEMRRGLDGESLVTTTLQAKNPRGLAPQVEKLIWKRLRSALEGAMAAEATTEEAQAPEGAEAPGSADRAAVLASDSPGSAGSSVATPSDAAVAGVSTIAPRRDATVAIGPRVVGRRFNYKDDLFGVLTTYDVPATAALTLEADFYPLPQFGLAASYSYTPSFNSALNGDSNEPFPTTSRDFMVGARARHQVAIVLARLDIDYGGHDFTIKGPMAIKPPIPNVRYRFIRIGGGATMPLLSRVSASVQAGYRHLFSAGEIESQSYFPRLEVAAVDARVSLEIALRSQWRVEIAATVERYFFSMNPEVGDSFVAGGAADQYQGAQLLLKYRL